MVSSRETKGERKDNSQGCTGRLQEDEPSQLNWKRQRTEGGRTRRDHQLMSLRSDAKKSKVVLFPRRVSVSFLSWAWVRECVHTSSSPSPPKPRTSPPTASTSATAARAYFRASSLCAGGSSRFPSPSASTPPSAVSRAATEGGGAKREPEERRMSPRGRERIRMPCTSAGEG
jgi:hypothetical protein